MKWVAVIIAVGLFWVPPALAQQSIWLVDIKGPIGPATADRVTRTLDQAVADSVPAVILRMDTPGGLDQAMRDIIQAILASPVPVIGYVAPSGSRAASAGTYILYAAHVAAMAPATSLGAATPVQIGGGMPLPSPADQPEKPGAGDSKDKADQAPDSAQAMRNKVVNDARAYIRGLAELRGRNAEWAERAVTEAATLNAKEALELDVIDVIAEGTDDLLRQVAGREVTTATGTRTLATDQVAVKIIEPDWRSRFLSVVTNPSVAYILLMVGIYGLIFEFSNPGVGAGGIIGGICLFLALYALQLLPISYSALALIVLGVGLMAAEAFTHTFGILGLGGLAAFIVGSIMLIDTDLPAFQIALPVILAVAVVSAGAIVLIFHMLLKTRHQPLVSGLSTLEGQVAEVEQIHHGRAMVRLAGESWQVHCDTPLNPGDRVRVDHAKGLVLEVSKIN